MFQIYLSRKSSIGVFVLLLAGATSRAWPGQLPSEAQSQINRQAAFLGKQPVKVNVKVLTQDIVAGSRAHAEVTVLNADNESIAAKEDWPCEMSIRYASGKSVSETVVIKKGEASAQFEFPAEEAGLTSIVAHPLSKGVRSDKIDVIVRPAAKPSKKKPPHPGASSVMPVRENPVIQAGAEVVNARLRMASFAVPAQGPNPTPGPSQAAPVLHISLNDPNGNYRANGRDAAVISVVYESPDLSPAPAEIHVWFHWTNGVLDPQPIRISKGSFSATAQLTSKWPGDVHLSFVNSWPAYKGEGDTDCTVRFVPPGAALVGPEKLSVVDSTPIMVVFYNADKNPVAPGRNWSVTLRSRQSRVQFSLASFEVQAASPVGSTQVFPVSWGNDTVEAVVADYTLQPLPIIITVWLVLALCLGGGVLGGVGAYLQFKDSWVKRIFFGVVGGAVLCWLYVYLGLPYLRVNIAHNTLSVLFVGIIGGYAGARILDAAVKQIPWLKS
jgi:hypothetical protein